MLKVIFFLTARQGSKEKSCSPGRADADLCPGQASRFQLQWLKAIVPCSQQACPAANPEYFYSLSEGLFDWKSRAYATLISYGAADKIILSGAPVATFYLRQNEVSWLKL